MRHLITFALAAAALMVACGSPDPGQNDSSMERDSGNPAVDASGPDSSPPVDAAVDNDVPVTPEDVQTVRDADMVIPGIGPVIMTGTFRCAPQLCREQLLTLQDGTSDGEPRRVTCNTAMTEANLTSIGFTSGDGWATCRGNSCFMSMGGSMLRAIVYPLSSEGCAPCGTIVNIDTSTGMELPPEARSERQSCGL